MNDLQEVFDKGEGSFTYSLLMMKFAPVGVIS